MRSASPVSSTPSEHRKSDTLCRHHFEAGLEERGYQAAKFAEVSATMVEERPNKLR